MREPDLKILFPRLEYRSLPVRVRNVVEGWAFKLLRWNTDGTETKEQETE